MSLLLQALQRAAKSRQDTGQEPDTGAGARLELEPQSGGVPGVDAGPGAGIDLDDMDPAPPRRTTASATHVPPYLSSGSDYGSATVLDYVRERPVVAFGALALLLAVIYGAYLYLQIFHPQWLRGGFGQSTSIVAANPPPPATLAAPAQETSPYTLPPAASYPGADPRTPDAAATTSAPNSAPTSGNAPTATPGSASGSGASTQPATNLQQNGELASLMNLPTKQPVRPAPAEAPSRLSTLGSALNDAPAASAPSKAVAPAPRLAEPVTPRATPSPVLPQPPPRSRNAPEARPNLAPAKPRPLSAPSTGAGIIELKDQVVINAAPAQQIEATTVADAYKSWRAGRLDQARDIYRDVLDNEPRNVDALLGLAGIAQQQGNSQEALSYFGRALEADPRNSSAQAGIIAITGQSDPGASEARLKQLIAREPSAFLHFTLGNLNARQSQWAQAQQSYFQAYSMNADNADYAYNLAVSLEHVGQEKLAITYYRKAVDLSLKQGGRASFNQEQVIDRITKLSLRAK